MARMMRTVGGESPVALIIFIITTVAGVAGCFFLFAAYSASKRALDDLEANIDFALVRPIERNDETREDILATIDNQRETGTRFGPDFFKYVAGIADKGVKYIDLAKLTGWPAETAAPYIDETGEYRKGDVQAFLDLPENEGLDSLQQLIGVRDGKIGRLTSQLNDARQKLEVAQDALNKEREVREQQAAQKDKEIADLKKTVTDKDAEIKKIQTDMKAQVDKEHKTALEALDKLAKGKEELQNEQKKLTELVDQALSMVRGELERQGRRVKVDQPMPDATVTERFQVINELLRQGLAPRAAAKEREERIGKVMRVDHKVGYAYLDIGSMDGVTKGELYTVYELGKAGQKVAKALLEIVDVDETFSTAGILDSDPRNPIIRGDQVIRGKGIPEPPAPVAATPPPAKAKEAGTKQEGGE